MKVKQAQSKCGGLTEHWFAFSDRSMITPSVGVNFASGRRRGPLKTKKVLADHLFARNKVIES